MAEKKKRVRATWTMVRALEARLNDQIEGTSRLVKDCDEWREKYRKVMAKNATLEKSNNYMEKAVDRLCEEQSELVRKNTSLNDELYSLKSRGFWDRLLNKE